MFFRSDASGVALGVPPDDNFDVDGFGDAVDDDATADGINDERLAGDDVATDDDIDDEPDLLLADAPDFLLGIIMPRASAKLVPIELSISSTARDLFGFLSAFSADDVGDSISGLDTFDRCLVDSSAFLRFLAGDDVDVDDDDDVECDDLTASKTAAGAACSCDALPELLRLDL